MVATCGQGYSPEPGSSNSSDSNTSSSSDCMPCALGFHKEAMDNSPCLACPKHATTNFSGTIDPSSCTCNDGYTTTIASQTSSSELGQSLVCVNARQYVSEKDAKAAAQAVSTAVGVVVGANVAVAVGTAVHARTNTHTHTHTHTHTRTQHACIERALRAWYCRCMIPADPAEPSSYTLCPPPHNDPGRLLREFGGSGVLWRGSRGSGDRGRRFFCKRGDCRVRRQRQQWWYSDPHHPSSIFKSSGQDR